MVLLAVVVALARRQTITLRYTIGWTLIALAALFGSLLTPLVKPLSDMLGMTPTGLLLVTASGVLLAITMMISVSVSGLQAQLRDIAEAHALLARRLEDFEGLDPQRSPQSRP